MGGLFPFHIMVISEKPGLLGPIREGVSSLTVLFAPFEVPGIIAAITIQLIIIDVRHRDDNRYHYQKCHRHHHPS